MEDSVVWKHSRSLCYLVKSIVAKVNEAFAPTLPKSVINIVRQKYIPPRAQLYVWMANLEKLKTGDFLAEKGIIDFQQALCPFYDLEAESNSHILFTRRFSWSSWMKMLEWWSISGVLHNRCRNFSVEWFGLVKSQKHRKLWGLVLGCVIWSLWYEKNIIKFEAKSPNVTSLLTR